jgi:hypothetical protein
MIRWLFIRTHDPSHSWQRIVWWWESRRVLYNLLVIGFAVALSTVQGLLTKGGGGGSPFILIGLFLLALVLINLYYTSGWIFELLVRRSDHPIVRWSRPRLFLIVLLSTMVVQLVASLGLTLWGLFNGHIEFALDAG